MYFCLSNTKLSVISEEVSRINPLLPMRPLQRTIDQKNFNFDLEDIIKNIP